MQPPEAFPNAGEAAKKALEKDDALPEAHLAAADVLAIQWDWAAAERECKRAIELDPNDAAAHSRYALVVLALTDGSTKHSKR